MDPLKESVKKPLPLTGKQEAFCQAILSGVSQADAYRKSYNAKKMSAPAVQVEASKLMGNPKVALRVQELRKPVAAKVQYGLEQAMAEADEAFKMAAKKENGGAMVAAATLRAKLNGLLIDRKEVHVHPVQELPDDALDRLIARKAQEAGVHLH